MTTTLKLTHRVAFFLIIGASAALVHMLTVFILVTYMQLKPLIANIFAFLLAFNVSFFGHKSLTFSKLADQKELSLPHFFLVASSVGLINQSLYFVLLRYTRLNYLVALFFVLAAVSVYSFLISRFWACR